MRKKWLLPLVILAVVALAGVFFWESNAKKTETGTDRPVETYVIMTRGRGMVIHGKPTPLKEWDRMSVNAGDTIRTLADSVATVVWPDSSVTRIKENSSLKIEIASRDQSMTNIFFVLERGASWSNVTGYFGGGGSFRQGIGSKDVIASVRGTVYEADVDSGYVHTLSHAVSVDNANTGKEFVVSEGNALNFASLQEVYDTMLDSKWQALNQKADLEYINQRIQETKAALVAQFGYSGTFDRVYDFIGDVISAAGIAKTSIESGKFEPQTTLRQIATAVVDGDVRALADIYNGTILAAGTGALADATRADLNARLADLYGQVNFMSDSAAALEIKSRLRDMIVATATGTEKSEYESAFATSSLYDYLTAKKYGYQDAVALLSTDLGKYVSNTGDYGVVEKFRSGLSPEEIKTFNDTMNGVRAGGVEILKRLESANYGEQIKQTANDALSGASAAAAQTAQQTVDAIRQTDAGKAVTDRNFLREWFGWLGF